MTAISALTSHASRDGLAVRPGHSPRNGPTIQAGKKPGLVTGARRLGRSAAISTTVRLEATSPSSEIAAIAGAHNAPSERPRGEIARGAQRGHDGPVKPITSAPGRPRCSPTACGGHAVRGGCSVRARSAATCARESARSSRTR